MMNQIKKMDRKIGATSQDKFNTIMYSIVGVVVVGLIAVGFMPAAHQMFSGSDASTQQIQQTLSHRQSQVDYTFSQFNN